MPDDRSSDRSATSLIALASVLLGLSVITVILRFYARRCQKAPLLIDDWLTLPALAAFIVSCVCLWLDIHYGTLGYSTGDFSKEHKAATLESSEKAQVALNIASLFCLTFVKASAIFFYRRIFCTPGRKGLFNTLIIATAIILACWLVAFAIFTGLQCHTHISSLWDGTQLKNCNLSYPSLEGYAISDVLLDIWVLILPIYPILRLQTTKRRKIAILTIFLIACIGIGSSIARMVIIIQLVHTGQAAVHKINPEQYVSRMSFYWTLEMGISIVAINLPSLWLIFTSVAPEAVLRSIRSVISLASIGSRGSKGQNGSQDHSHAEHSKLRASNSTEVPISEAFAQAESFEPGSVTGNDKSDVLAEKVPVNRSVEQTTNSQYHEVV